MFQSELAKKIDALITWTDANLNGDPVVWLTMADRLSNDEIAMAAIILSVIAFLLGAGFGVLIGSW